MLTRLEDAAKPLVAAIHGNAFGGGLELAHGVPLPRRRRRTRRSASPKCCSASSPAPAARSGCRGSPARSSRIDDVHRRQAGPGAEGAGRRHRRRDRRRAICWPGAIAFAKARAAAGEPPQDARDRDHAGQAASRTSRRAARPRSALAEDRARRARAARRRSTPSKPALDAGVRRRLGARARAVRRLRRLDRVEGAAPPVLRRARSRQGARRPEGHADRRHPARRRRRRRHDGRRHRDELRQRRHPGAPQGGRRRGAAARPGDDPQELRSRRCRRAR